MDSNYIDYKGKGVMCFGFMGMGKSTLGNTLLNVQPGTKFKEDSGADTCTTDITVE
jgi:hypothetical protein